MAVVAPGRPAQTTPDGLFDVLGLPTDADLGQATEWATDSVVLVDELGPDIADALRSRAFRAGFYLTTAGTSVSPPWTRLRLLPDPGHSDLSSLAPYVPVNPLAAEHRHHGFGFTGYVLILSDPEEGVDPPVAADWIGGALPGADVLVVADGIASAWKQRTLRGRVGIDTRTDLWRLMAHASVCIDLAPGALVGLECIEALRYGTPVIVPDACGAATVHARASSGHTFANESELVAATLDMQEPEKRAAASASGKAYADGYFGDPDGFVRNLAALLAE